MAWNSHRLLASRSYTAAYAVISIVLIIEVEVVHVMILHINELLKPIFFKNIEYQKKKSLLNFSTRLSFDTSA